MPASRSKISERDIRADETLKKKKNSNNNTNFVIFVQVCTEGRLILEFAFDDLMRIKTWHFTIRQYRELIPRSILAMHVSVTSLTRDTTKSSYLDPPGSGVTFLFSFFFPV